MKKLTKHIPAEVVRFTVIGIATTAIHFVVLHFFYVVLSNTIVLSTLIAFSVAVCFSYVMSYRFTFRSRAKHNTSLPKFATTVTIGLAWNLSLMYLMVDILSWHYVISFVITTSVVMTNNFLLSKYWVF